MKAGFMSTHFLRYSSLAANLSLMLFEVDVVIAITNFTSYIHRAVLSANVRKFRGIKFHQKMDTMEANETR